MGGFLLLSPARHHRWRAGVFRNCPLEQSLSGLTLAPQTDTASPAALIEFVKDVVWFLPHFYCSKEDLNRKSFSVGISAHLLKESLYRKNRPKERGFKPQIFDENLPGVRAPLRETQSKSHNLSHSIQIRRNRGGHPIITMFNSTIRVFQSIPSNHTHHRSTRGNPLLQL